MARSTTGGVDTAELHDSAGNDRFDASPTYAAMYGSNFYNRANYFVSVTGRRSEGEDIARLYDSTGDDFLEADEDWATLSYGNRTRIKLQELVTGATVTADSSLGGHDKKRIKAIDFVLITLGPWEPVD